MAYIKRSTEEKKKFAKSFTREQQGAYRKGKKMGFLDGVHAPKR
ncbi:MAG: hypothetical protein RR140_02485 [Clostridia bacterium]